MTQLDRVVFGLPLKEYFSKYKSYFIAYMVGFGIVRLLELYVKNPGLKYSVQARQEQLSQTLAIMSNIWLFVVSYRLAVRLRKSSPRNSMELVGKTGVCSIVGGVGIATIICILEVTFSLIGQNSMADKKVFDLVAQLIMIFRNSIGYTFLLALLSEGVHGVLFLMDEKKKATEVKDENGVKNCEENK